MRERQNPQPVAVNAKDDAKRKSCLWKPPTMDIKLFAQFRKLAY